MAGRALQALFPESGPQPAFVSHAVIFVGPGDEFAKTTALAPKEREKARGAGWFGCETKESFHAPAQVWALPRPQAIASRHFPVIGEHAHHLSETHNCASMRAEMQESARGPQPDGSIASIPRASGTRSQRERSHGGTGQAGRRFKVKARLRSREILRRPPTADS